MYICSLYNFMTSKYECDMNIYFIYEIFIVRIGAFIFIVRFIDRRLCSLYSLHSFLIVL